METIRGLRERRGLSQDQLAVLVGKSTGYIDQVEHGEAEVPDKIAAKVGAALGVSGSRVLAINSNALKIARALKLAAQVEDAHLRPGVAKAARLALKSHFPLRVRDQALDVAVKAEAAQREKDEVFRGFVTKDAASRGTPASGGSSFGGSTLKLPSTDALDPAVDVRGLPVAQDGDGNYWVVDPTTGEPVGPFYGDVVQQQTTTATKGRDSFGRRRDQDESMTRDNLGRKRSR